jgi:Fe2+ or Zn2+ uptake regulation protein
MRHAEAHLLNIYQDVKELMKSMSIGSLYDTLKILRNLRGLCSLVSDQRLTCRLLSLTELNLLIVGSPPVPGSHELYHFANMT